MRVLAVIDQRKVIKKILLHLNLWSGLPAFMPPRGPPPAIPCHSQALGGRRSTIPGSVSRLRKRVYRLISRADPCLFSGLTWEQSAAPKFPDELGCLPR
jgi:hypothetical protein